MSDIDECCIQQGQQPKVYSKIMLKTKIRLLELICNGSGIRSAAKLLKVKESTAKMIWKKFKDTGKIGKNIITLKTDNEDEDRLQQKQIQKQEEKQNQNLSQKSIKMPIYVIPIYPQSIQKRESQNN